MNRKEGEGYQPQLEGFDESLKDGLFREFLPYSDLNQWIPEGTVYENVINSFPVLRLQDIRALSFLSYQGPQVSNDYFVEFFHTRLDHSLVVALTTERILRQNVIPQEKINIGILAALIHDIGTPALGDATKTIDREALDEEENWAESMGDNAIKLLDDYGTNQSEIDSIIKNIGVLGQVLDIADRITYVMKDTYAVIGPVGKHNTYVNLYFNTGDLIGILDRFPKIGNIFQDVGVDQRNGHVFFNNPDRLEEFLLLRALLHQKLYLHPISQGRDMFIGKLLEPLYSRTDPDKLTPFHLRIMNDQDLLRAIGNEYFPSKDIESYFPDLVNWYPQYERFDSEEQAEKRRQELSQDENIAVIGIKESFGFDSATSYKVLDPRGKIVEFREYNPIAARNIEAMADETKGVLLFYADVSEDSPTSILLKTLPKP